MMVIDYQQYHFHPGRQLVRFAFTSTTSEIGDGRSLCPRNESLASSFAYQASETLLDTL